MQNLGVKRSKISMKLKERIKVFVLIILCLSAGFYFYQNWTSETLWGIFFVIMFVAAPICIVLTMRLWTRCPRCRRSGTIKTIGTELRKKGIDPDRPPDHSISDRDDTSLDQSLDLYDLFCRYQCKSCDFEWEEKPPPTYRFDSPPPPYENGREG
jgi:hypothetical protein